MPRRRPLALVAVPLLLAGCYAAASEAGRMDLVRKQAALDLECPRDQLTVTRETGFTYRVEGCGRRSFQEVVCIETDCQSESKLTQAIESDDQMPEGTAAARRLINPGADDEEMPMPNQLATLERAYAGRFRICVAPSGAVDEVQVLKSTGRPEVDRLWRERLLAWRYEPARSNGEPIRQCVEQSIRYERSKRQPPDRLFTPGEAPDTIYPM